MPKFLLCSLLHALAQKPRIHFLLGYLRSTAHGIWDKKEVWKTTIPKVPRLLPCADTRSACVQLWAQSCAAPRLGPPGCCQGTTGLERTLRTSKQQAQLCRPDCWSAAAARLPESLGLSVNRVIWQWICSLVLFHWAAIVQGGGKW